VLQETSGTTELVVFGGGRACVRQVSQPHLREPIVGDERPGNQDDRRHAVGRRLVLEAPPRERAPGGGLTIVGLPPNVDRLFDLGILGFELEGAGQGRRQIERHPGDQQ
jgi:hypothetical protein